MGAEPLFQIPSLFPEVFDESSRGKLASICEANSSHRTIASFEGYNRPDRGRGHRGRFDGCDLHRNRTATYR
jgi:hypothetical protein